MEELKHIHTDVICLQECFEASAIHNICNALQFRYKHMYNETQDKPFYNTNSGLVILSKYPLKNVHYERYTHHSFLDSLAHKGFVCCEVVSPSHRLVLCNTHLQSDYSVLQFASTRQQQLHQLLRYIQQTYTKNKSTHCPPMVLCGDWNIPLYSQSYYTYFKTLLQTELPQHHVHSHKTRTKELCNTHQDGLLDYFVVRPGRCSAYQPQCLSVSTNPVYTFSDHKWTMLQSSQSAKTRYTKRRHTHKKHTNDESDREPPTTHS